MYEKEVLEFLKGRVSQYGYDVSFAYMKSKGKILGLFKRRYEIKPTTSNTGYIISTGTLDYIKTH